MIDTQSSFDSIGYHKGGIVVMKAKRRVSTGKVKPILIRIGLILFFIAMAFHPGVGQAERLVKPEWVMPKYYPNGFHGMGHINEIYIDKNLVVIDDRAFKLYATTEYHTPDQEHASSALFVPGSFVGYLKDSTNTITSMWLITKE